jgi:hypothetical protein
MNVFLWLNFHMAALVVMHTLDVVCPEAIPKDWRRDGKPLGSLHLKRWPW